MSTVLTLQRTVGSYSVGVVSNWVGVAWCSGVVGRVRVVVGVAVAVVVLTTGESVRLRGSKVHRLGGSLEEGEVETSSRAMDARLGLLAL